VDKILTTDSLRDGAAGGLQRGDGVRLTGWLYTARDAAHRRMTEMIRNGEEPPFPFRGQVVFYAGPCPAPPGRVIGSVGPTTSGRMDAYSPFLIERGLKFMIGKGARSKAVADAIRVHGGVYFTAVGGVAALMAGCVSRSEIVAFEDLGAEAIRRIYAEELPLTVSII
jgi:fumarate hydratase subunit beta